MELDQPAKSANRAKADGDLRAQRRGPGRQHPRPLRRAISVSNNYSLPKPTTRSSTSLRGTRIGSDLAFTTIERDHSRGGATKAREMWIALQSNALGDQDVFLHFFPFFFLPPAPPPPPPPVAFGGGTTDSAAPCVRSEACCCFFLPLSCSLLRTISSANPGLSRFGSHRSGSSSFAGLPLAPAFAADAFFAGAFEVEARVEATKGADL